jgi:hypothetical protein
MRLVIPEGWLRASDTGWINAKEFIGEDQQVPVNVFAIYPNQTSPKIIGWLDTTSQTYTRNTTGAKTLGEARRSGADVEPTGAGPTVIGPDR